jgi:hypothetical protein
VIQQQRVELYSLRPREWKRRKFNDLNPINIRKAWNNKNHEEEQKLAKIQVFFYLWIIQGKGRIHFIFEVNDSANWVIENSRLLKSWEKSRVQEKKDSFEIANALERFLTVSFYLNSK